MSITLFKKASRLLLITQLFSTLSFAVLYSTLVLFMTQALGFTVTKASAGEYLSPLIMAYIY
ncbi:hypothetical protein ADP75_01675 [Francisella tularensis]|nr:hypothetical protein ADP75_01675 [Francisella tularensis]